MAVMMINLGKREEMVSCRIGGNRFPFFVPFPLTIGTGQLRFKFFGSPYKGQTTQ